MRRFKTKEEAFLYLKKKFYAKDVKGIVVIGSTAKGKLKNFSDIDVVIFNEKKLKPYYEICLVKGKLVLITSYFYKAGKAIRLPKNGRIIYGNYYSQIEHPKSRIYDKNARFKRDNQMFIDGLFKFLRSKDKRYLDWIDKYGRF